MGLKYKENTTANYYVYMLESGNDANDGLTPANAVKSCERVVAILNAYTGTKRRYCVSDRRKIYNETISVTRTSTKPITFEFLNRCIIDGSGASYIKFTVPGDTIINAMVVGYKYRYISSLIAGSVITFENVFFLDCTNHIHSSFPTTAGSIAYLFRRCIFANSSMPIVDSGSNNVMYYYNCVFNTVNASPGMDKINIFTNCNFIGVNLITLVTGYRFYNCNIYGTINGQNNAYYQALGYNIEGISADPLFNDLANGVYTVTSASPCLYAGTQNQHIGIGEAFYLSATDLLTDAVDSDNVEISSGKLIRTDVDLDGFVETKVFHNGTNRIIDLIQLAATLGFVDADVIQSVELLAADAGNPYVPFLTFKMKVGETESACNASDYILLPFDQRPYQDEAGIGNGSEDINVTDTWASVKINYFKLYIYITNP